MFQQKSFWLLLAFIFLALACDTKTKTVDSCGDGFLEDLTIHSGYGEVRSGAPAVPHAFLHFAEQLDILHVFHHSIPRHDDRRPS